MQKIVLILAAGFFISCGASGKRLSRDGYEWVPTQNVVVQATGKQTEMLSLVGKPTAIWKTQFGTVMWVYCQYGVPVRTVVFGKEEMIKGGTPDTNRTDLCEEP